MSAIAEAVGIERASLSDATVLNDGNWDSLAQMAAISEIDEKFGVTVPAKDLMAAHTVGELRQLVERALSQSS